MQDPIGIVVTISGIVSPLHFQHLICREAALDPLVSTGLLIFGSGTYGFVHDLLKFLFPGKLLFCFMYDGGLNPNLWLSKKVLDLSLLLLMFSCLSCPFS